MIFAQWPLAARFLAGTTTEKDYRRETMKRALAELLPGQLCWLRQMHGATVFTPANYAGPSSGGDGFFSSDRAFTPVVITADCLPIVIGAEDGSGWAALHGGWRGLARGIIAATVAQFPAGAVLHAWIGPHIRRDSYQVDAAFASNFPDHREAFRPDGPGHLLADLTLIARRQLEAAGVASVSDCGLDSFSDRRFHSYRRSRGGAVNCGHMATFIFPLN